MLIREIGFNAGSRIARLVPDVVAGTLQCVRMAQRLLRRRHAIVTFDGEAAFGCATAGLIQSEIIRLIQRDTQAARQFSVERFCLVDQFHSLCPPTRSRLQG
jgi:hypothetical protein